MKLRLATALLAATLVAAGAAATTTADAATTATAPTTAVALRDLDGVGLFGGGHPGSSVWVSPAQAVSVTETAGVVEADAGSGHLRVRLRPHAGVPLAVGRYSVVPGPTTDPRELNADVLDSHRAETLCGRGTLDVLEAVRPTGTLTAFSAELKCTSYAYAVSLRWNGTEPFVGMDAPGSVSVGGVEVGAPSPPEAVTLRPRGTAPVTFGAATASVTWYEDGSVVEPGDPAFQVVSDGCNGRTLTSGQSCTVTVRSETFHPGNVQGRLVVPDSSSPGRTGVFLGAMAYVDTLHRFETVTPKRLLDTRSGAPLGPGAFRTLRVTGGTTGVPAESDGVLLSVTAVSPTSDGFLTIAQQRWTPPRTSTVNFRRGATRANTAFIVPWPTATGATIDVYNSSGSTHVLVDVVGYSVPPNAVRQGSLYVPLAPERALDTRSAGSGGPLAPGEDLDLTLDLGADLNPTVSAVVANLTAVRPSAGGFVTAWSGAVARPTVSQLGFVRGETTPVLSVIPARLVGGLPTVRLHNGSTGSTGLLVDVVGVLDRGAYVGYKLRGAEGRLFDTRTGLGATRGAIGADSWRSVNGTDATVTPETDGLLANVTAIRPTTATWLVGWGGATPRPWVSNLNVGAGRTNANAVVSDLASGRWRVYNAAGSVHVAADVMAYLDWSPVGAAGMPPAGPSGSSGAAGPAPSGGPSPLEAPANQVLDARVTARG